MTSTDWALAEKIMRKALADSPVRSHQIPTGAWQRAVGWALVAIGLVALLVSAPIAAGLFTLGGVCGAWGLLLGYLHAQEVKLLHIIARLEGPPPGA